VLCCFLELSIIYAKKNLPAEQEAGREKTRIHEKNVNQERAKRIEPPQNQGS
jgi:hypothetical protein